MDKIGSTNQEYEKIHSIAVSIFLFIIQAYLMLLFCGVDVFNFSAIEDVALRYILQVVVQLILFGAIFSIIHFVVKKIYCLHWIATHKNIWVQGLWLHVHMKNEPRIGTVYLKQNFYTISANGKNIYPDGIDKEQRVTTWYYMLGAVRDDREQNADLIGYYRAGKVAEESSKDGIHVLDIDNRNSKCYSYSMYGHFRDTVKPNGGETDEHIGELYFFKPSKAVLSAITDPKSGRVDDEKLAKLHCNPRFQQEEYVKVLKKVIKECERAKEVQP